MSTRPPPGRESVTQPDLAQWLRQTAGRLINGSVEDGAVEAAKLVEAAEEIEQLNFTFDLQWQADQRATKAWQEAHPDKQRVWPDRCCMVIWLMEQLAAAESRSLTIEAETREACAARIGKLERENVIFSEIDMDGDLLAQRRRNDEEIRFLNSILNATAIRAAPERKA